MFAEPKLKMRPSRAYIFLIAILNLAVVAGANGTRAQTKNPQEKPAPFCDAGRARSLIEQQVSESKTLEKRAARINVLTLAAELLWPSREETARAAFAEAYELAAAHYMERGDELIPVPGMRADRERPGLVQQLPDHRFTIIRAVARRDPAWAKRLSERAAEETRAHAEKKAEADRSRARNVGEKLLQTAARLLAEDMATALLLARQSLREEASQALPRFLYEAAKSDRAAADAFYLEALAAYSAGDVESILNLSPYPFAVNRIVGQGLNYGVFPAPPGFAPNAELQKKFVAAFLLSAERELKAARERPAVATTGGPSEVEKALSALLALDALYGPADPSFAARAASLKEIGAAMLAPTEQQRANTNSRLDLTVKTGGGFDDSSGVLDRVLEQAEQIKDPERRDQRLVLGLQGALMRETPERIEAAGEKISDTETRRQFMNFARFVLAQRAIKAERLDDAAALAERIDALDERALVLLDIAADGLKRLDDRQRAVELLEAVVKSARAAPDALAKGRAQLGVAHLYAGFDHQRAVEVMAEAVMTVNRLVDPDFSAAFMTRRIEGKTFGTYTSHPGPGFNLENAFREIGAHDFEGAVLAANGLQDKSLRALATIAVAAKCVEGSKPQVKPAPKPSAKRDASRKPTKSQ